MYRRVAVEKGNDMASDMGNGEIGGSQDTVGGYRV